jgi:hypothetical protein
LGLSSVVIVEPFVEQVVVVSATTV